MPATINLGPDRVNAYLYPPNPGEVTLTWPTGELAGRTFTSTLDGDPITVDIAGDIMTITVAPAIVAALELGQPVDWKLTETTGADPVVLFAGRWVAETGPAARTAQAFTVTTGGTTVAIAVTGAAGFGQHLVDLDAHGDPYITRPRGWGSRWFAALDEADTRLVRAAGLGDSVTCGLFADDHDLGWFGRVRTPMQAEWGDGGSGWLDWFNTAVGGFGGPGGPNNGDTTQTGAWTEVPGGINGNTRRPTVAGSGATMTFHPRGSALDIVTRTDPTFGRYDYAIDGAAAVQVPQNAAAAVSILPVATTPGSHSVVITAAAGQCRIAGIRGKNATGLMFDNLSIGGRSIVSQGVGLDVAAEGMAGATTLSATFDMAPPLDLIMVALGVNDAVAAASPNYDTMWSVLNNLHREIRAAGVNSTTPPEVVVIIEHISGFADTSSPYKYPRIAAILHEWAASIGAAVVDMWAAGRHSGEYVAGLNWFGFGLVDVHLATAGSVAYSDAVMSLINPDA